jgi:hypothetical protein
MHRIISEIGGDMIAIAAIVMGIGFAMFSLYLHSRRKREFLQMHHAERKAAIEKGIELPPVPPRSEHGRSRPRRFKSLATRPNTTSVRTSCLDA